MVKTQGTQYRQVCSSLCEWKLDLSFCDLPAYIQINKFTPTLIWLQLQPQADVLLTLTAPPLMPGQKQQTAYRYPADDDRHDYLELF